MDVPIKNIYEDENDNDELQNLIDNFNLIKLDNEIDFVETFKNQMNFLIKPDAYKNFFDFKSKKDISILDFILNFATKIKPKSQGRAKKEIKDNKNPKKENEQKSNINIQKNTNSENRNDRVKKNKNDIKDKNDKKVINNDLSFLNFSHLLFLFNASNLFDNYSLNESKDNKILQKDDEFGNKKKDNLKKDKEQLNENEELIIEENREHNLLFLRKGFKFEGFEEKKEMENKEKGINEKEKIKINIVKSYEDTSYFNGKSFEYDSISYIFKKIYTISINKDFSILYDFIPENDKINYIFDKNRLYKLNDIQFDFIIKDLKISELLQFLIDVYSGIHPNSKINFINGEKFFTKMI